MPDAAAGTWSGRAAAAHLRGYEERADGEPFASPGHAGAGVVLRALLLERALGELGHEPTHRPAWVRVPLRGILGLLAGGAERFGDAAEGPAVVRKP